MMYEQADKKISKLKKITWNKFLRYKAVAKFDETNVLRNSKKLYKDLYDLYCKEYLDVAQKRYKEECLLVGKEKSKIDEKWLLAFLLAYNPVTNYVYKNEFERKRDRYIESVMSSGSTMENTRTGFKYIENQMEQGFIDVEDKAQMKAFEDNGVKYLKWVTEKDDKVCKTCLERDGKIYKIQDYPSKPHIRCRCHAEAVSKEE